MIKKRPGVHRSSCSGKRRRVSREDAKEREEREDYDKKGLLILFLALALFAFLRVSPRIAGQDHPASNAMAFNERPSSFQ